MANIETTTSKGTRRIAIEPVSRVEGHGKVTLLLDDAGIAPLNDWDASSFQVEKFEIERMAWLEHLRLSSVRFNSGGSGSLAASSASNVRGE